ncbi:MAG: hypothetical protein P4L27_00120 [Ignavibacteriaceae bacterium]|nr:hypothetical protein [Ignavibacteriaceae bacterium]
MSTKKNLVIQHLENISWEVLESYPEVVQKFIKGKAGVYALYKRKNLYYVGLAKNLMWRIKQHLLDRHKGRWDRFSVYLTVHDEHIKELESLILRMVNPKGNKIKGQFAKSENLRKIVNRKIKETDDSNRAKLLGGIFEQKNRKYKLKNRPKKNYFAGLLNKRMPLRGSYKGKLFHATLRKDGTFSHKNQSYPSPTAAAVAVTGGKVINGRTFWKFKNDKGEWVNLNHFDT